MQDVQSRPVSRIKIRAGDRGPLVDFRELARYFDLLLNLAARDVKVRYKQTVLGVLWVVLQPLLAALIFSFVFGVVARLPSQGRPYLLFAFSGMLVWNLFANAVTRSSSALLANAHMVTKVYFPREILPLSAILSALLDFAVALAVMALLSATYRVRPGVGLLLLPAWLAILLLLALGIGLMTGALMVRYRDAQHIIPMLLTLGMYASPVAWSVTAVPPRYQWVYELNPLSGLIEASRWSLLGEGACSVPALAYASAVALLTFGIGTVVFRRLERASPMPSDDLAVAVRGVGKSYTIAHGAARPSTLREAITERVRRSFHIGNGNGKAEARRETFWALRDVDFELRRGEVLGIVGRNGAGKSTLLKILSRITAPTTGEIEINGTLASLLEVGTGFHPELTGRENIFLNGTVLGIKKKQIARRFDAIVDFAGVERFLDTPVKHYSSGMYLRLAFAVAAHLEPDILILDEVLAVGDADFQRKCLGKLEQVAEQDGRTIILVSHTMAAVEALCDRAIYLDRGRIVRDGPAREIVSHYLATAGARAVEGTPLAERTHRTGNGKLRFTSFHIEDEAGNPVTHVASGRDITVVFGFEAATPGNYNNVDVGVSVHTSHDLTLFVYYSSYSGNTLRVDRPSGSFRCTLSRLPLLPGEYQVGARMTMDGEEVDWPRDRVGSFYVEAGDFYGSGRKGCEDGPTCFMIDGKWDIR